jgi:hypothetical protein
VCGYFDTRNQLCFVNHVHISVRLQQSATSSTSSAGPRTLLQLRVFDRVNVSIKVDEGSGNGGDRKLVIGLVHQDTDLAEVLRTRGRKSQLTAATQQETAEPGEQSR